MLSVFDLNANQPILHVPRSRDPAAVLAWRTRAWPYWDSMLDRASRKAWISLHERRPDALRATSAS